jgi:hypothetical protein
MIQVQVFKFHQDGGALYAINKYLKDYKIHPKQIISIVATPYDGYSTHILYISLSYFTERSEDAS